LLNDYLDEVRHAADTDGAHALRAVAVTNALDHAADIAKISGESLGTAIS
jgi:hypothetical protein